MTYKEKKRIFLELMDGNSCEADCALLKKKEPNPKLYLLYPKRYANEILFRLLDLATKEEIIQFRKDFFKKDETPASETDPEPNNEPKTDDAAAKVDTVETHEERAENAEKRAQEAENRAEEAEKRAQDAENRADEETERADEESERADDAEQARDEAEERATAAEEALEKEKKKVKK